MSTLGDAADVYPLIKFLPHTCVARVCQDWHLPRDQGWTYRVPVRQDRKLECLSLCWHAPLRRDHPDYCTAEVGNPGGTYELPCIIPWTAHIIGGKAPTKQFFLRFKLKSWILQFEWIDVADRCLKNHELPVDIPHFNILSLDVCEGCVQGGILLTVLVKTVFNNQICHKI